MTAQGETTGPSSVWPALAVIIAVSVFTVTLGIIYPYLTILLELRAFTPSFVGVNAAMVPIGLTIGSVLAPRIAMITGPYLMSLAAIAARRLHSRLSAVVHPPRQGPNANAGADRMQLVESHAQISPILPPLSRLSGIKEPAIKLLRHAAPP